MSVDAGHEETYAKTRNTDPANFQRVLDNTRQLAQAIKREDSTCLLGVGWVVTPDNWEEIELGVNVASATGASYVRLSAMFSPDGAKPYRDIYKQIKDSTERAMYKYQTASFRVHDLFTDRLEDLIEGPPDYKTCSYQYYTTYIGADMSPYRCCVLAYNNRGKVANLDLKTLTFGEVWNSNARKTDMKMFDARGCERCQFNDKNRAMSYLLEKEVIHEEFP